MTEAGVPIYSSSFPKSPSFYQPDCLEQYFVNSKENKLELLKISTQFNHFPTWSKFPEYQQQCFIHLSTSTNKKEFMLYAKVKLENGDLPGAISILESCPNQNWPDVNRLKSPSVKPH